MAEELQRAQLGCRESCALVAARALLLSCSCGKPSLPPLCVCSVLWMQKAWRKRPKTYPKGCVETEI